MDLLFTPDFESSCIGHLENTCLLSYAALPGADTFHYTVSDSLSTDHTTQVFKCGSCLHAHSSRNVFQNSNFCIKLEF